VFLFGRKYHRKYTQTPLTARTTSWASRELRSLDWLRIDRQLSRKFLLVQRVHVPSVHTRLFIKIVYVFVISCVETAALENTKANFKFIDIALSGLIEIPKSYNKVDTITKYTEDKNKID
jgi:hypothetical protein